MEQPYSYSGYTGSYDELPLLDGQAASGKYDALTSPRSPGIGLALFLMTISTCWGSYLEDSGTGLAITVAYFSQFFVAGLGFLVIASIGFRGSSLKMTTEFVLFLGLAIWAMIGFPFTVSTYLTKIAVVTLLKLLVMGVIILNAVNGRRSYLWLVAGLMLAMVFASAGAVTGLARGVEIVGEGYGATRRYTGTFGNANEAGRLAALGAWAAFSLFLAIRSRFVKVLLLVVMAWGVIVVGWTGSKQNIIALFLGAVCAYWFVLRRSSRGLGARTAWLVAISIVMIAMVAYFGTTYGGERVKELLESQGGLAEHSDQTRLDLLTASFKAFIQNPIFGVGYGGVGSVIYGRGYKSPHNTIVSMAANTGLPGWLMFFGAWLVAINRLRRVGKLALPPVDYRLAMSGWVLFAMFGFWTLTGELQKFKPFWVCFAGLVAYLLWIERMLQRDSEDNLPPYA